MGPSLISPPHQHAGAAHSPWRSLLLVLSFVRYRFFLYAGLLPYVLGAAWAYGMAGTFDAAVFWSGLGGIVLAVVGVESFNEYFDDRMGTDRVFNPADLPPMFGWFSNSLPGYPETLSLKCRVHAQPDGLRPLIELEETDHPLSVQHRQGVPFSEAVAYVHAHLDP